MTHVALLSRRLRTLVEHQRHRDAIEFRRTLRPREAVYKSQVLTIASRTVAFVVFKDIPKFMTREARDLRDVRGPGLWPVQILDEATRLAEREIDAGNPWP